MRRTFALALVMLAVVAAPAAADDDRTHFRRTTPRASLDEDAGAFTIGVPSGRAWGIESELRPLPPERALAVRLRVADDDVREAFARVAYYASATGRPRQIAITDSEAVAVGWVGSSTWRLIRRPRRSPTGSASWRACGPAPLARTTTPSTRA
jgi:hypothetical protein